MRIQPVVRDRYRASRLPFLEAAWAELCRHSRLQFPARAWVARCLRPAANFRCTEPRDAKTSCATSIPAAVGSRAGEDVGRMSSFCEWFPSTFRPTTVLASTIVPTPRSRRIPRRNCTTKTAVTQLLGNLRGCRRSDAESISSDAARSLLVELRPMPKMESMIFVLNRYVFHCSIHSLTILAPNSVTWQKMLARIHVKITWYKLWYYSGYDLEQVLWAAIAFFSTTSIK